MGASQPKICIAGAGIGGLTAALCLAEAGFDVSVFEKSAELPKQGAGIQISPNAFKILDGLGLSASVLEAGHAPEALEIRDGFSGRRLTEFQFGRNFEKRHNAPYLTVGRARLASKLHAVCTDNPSVSLNFATPIEKIQPDFDAYIGADGVWSSMRAQIPSASIPQFTGRVAWRAVIKSSDQKAIFSTTKIWLGPSAHVVAYPINDAQINVVAIVPSNEPGTTKGWINGEKLDGQSYFRQWCTDVFTLLNCEAQWGCWPIYAVEDVGAMAAGNVALVGDAAHAMVPYAAQGGAAAIEDAAVLASCLKAQPTEIAQSFKEYERARLPRLRDVINLSNNNRRIYHMANPLRFARNAVMQIAPQAALQKRMDWLYGWEAPSKI